MVLLDVSLQTLPVLAGPDMVPLDVNLQTLPVPMRVCADWAREFDGGDIAAALAVLAMLTAKFAHDIAFLS